MLTQYDISRDKTVSDLGREAAHFLMHTVIAVALLAATIGLFTVAHPDPDSLRPKLFATVLAFLIPMIGGFLLARMHRDSTARYIWLSGVVILAVACVRVLDLTTGPGMCDSCGAAEKITRTFFSFNHGSGLMDGNGVLIGAWTPLATIGYSLGAKLGF